MAAHCSRPHIRVRALTVAAVAPQAAEGSPRCSGWAAASQNGQTASTTRGEAVIPQPSLSKTQAIDMCKQNARPPIDNLDRRAIYILQTALGASRLRHVSGPDPRCSSSQGASGRQARPGRACGRVRAGSRAPCSDARLVKSLNRNLNFSRD